MNAVFSRSVLCLAAATLAASALAGQTVSSTDLKYQLPPEVMVKMVDAPPTPIISLSPAHGAGPRRILIEQSSSLPTIADLAEPELRLAGLRFNPKVGAPSRTRYFVALKLQTLPTAGSTTQSKEVAIAGLPVKPHVLFARWSPDGLHIALVNPESGTVAGLSLWVVDVAKAREGLLYRESGCRSRKR
jgi:hypothetical protein